MEELHLADAIDQLRNEIESAIMRSQGRTLKFGLNSVELELQVQVSNKATAKAEFKWVVVSAGGDASTSTGRSHRVKLTLTPKSETDQPLLVAEPGPRPD
jgi:hypothetical protein